jgi:hypothetical protein
MMGASKRLAELARQALQQTAPRTQFETVRFGNVLGQCGQRDPEVPATECEGRAGDGDASGNLAVLHDDSRSCATGAASVEHGPWRRDLHLGYGRAGTNRGSGARSDPAVRIHGRADPDRVHGLAAGRKAVRRIAC